MIVLINKYAATTLLETLQHEVDNAWPLINRAQVPIYLETSPAQWTSFNSLLNLLVESRYTLPPNRFIKLIQTAAMRFVEQINTQNSLRPKTLSLLVEQLPVKSITVNNTNDKSSIEIDIPVEGDMLFLSELYLLAVTHFYIQTIAPSLGDPIQYHLKYPDAIELSNLQVNKTIPQFLGQNQTALFYSTASMLGGSHKQSLSYSQQVSAALEGYIGRDNLSVEQFSNIIGVNERTIQRKLKCEGNTFRKLKESLNIAFAKRVMIQRNASISDVAEHLGYSDTSQFIRAFKRSENITPYQWFKRTCE